VSKKSVTAMRSHNHCVFVCKVFAGLLAHCIESASHFDLS
jgi:hypothetical protein